MDNLYGSICLTDIPKDLIVTAKNGKKYLNIEVRERQTPGQYGHTHYIKAACRKEQRQEGVNYYIGELKPSRYNEAAAPAAAQPANGASQSAVPTPPPAPDNLPF